MAIRSRPRKRSRLDNCVGEASQPPSQNILLDDDVIDHIISYLPIKYAAKTSILSKRFENSWQCCESICFDLDMTYKLSQINVLNMIHRVMSLHSTKKIKKFQLCINTCTLEPYVLTWVNKALSKKPEVLELDFLLGKYNVEQFEIPFEIIDVDFIKSLTLIYCSLDPPPDFKNLHFLRVLTLRHIKLMDRETFFDIVIANCLFLECIDIAKCIELYRLSIVTKNLKFFKELRISECSMLADLYVNSPTLEIFWLIGKRPNIEFEGTMMHLNDVIISFRRATSILPKYKMLGVMQKIFNNVRVLTINSTMLDEVLCSNFLKPAGGARHYLWHVKELQLLMEITSFCSPLDIVNFVERCPMLERLFINFQKFSFDGKSPLWQLHGKECFERWNMQFSFLKLVKFTSCNIKKESEEQLVKLILENSPNLETFVIFTVKKYYRNREDFYSTISTFEERMLSWRLSPNSLVGVYDDYDETSDLYVPIHEEPQWYFCPLERKLV